MLPCHYLSPYSSAHNIAFVIRESRIVFKDNVILAKLAAAQSILESNLYGTPSKLAYNYNNLFGIKGSGTAGSVWLQTTECFSKCIQLDAKFAVNETIGDSFKQYRAVLEHNRYKNVWKSKTFEEAARLVQADGYATDKSYSKQLIAIYNKYIKNSTET